MMESWGDRKTVQKGNIGEQIVRRYLEQLGFIVYQPVTSGAHAFDKLCISKDKKEIFIAEVKTKPHRLYYPDTGLDTRHLNEYRYIQNKYNVDVFLFFVDEVDKQVYGNTIRELEKPREVKDWLGNIYHYPKEEWNQITYFPLVAMKSIGAIDAVEAEQLSNLSTRGLYDYRDTP